MPAIVRCTICISCSIGNGLQIYSLSLSSKDFFITSSSNLRKPLMKKIVLFDILDECLDTVRKQSKKKIAIIDKLDYLRNILIHAEAVQIQEVFHNILNNAFDAILDEAGRIEIEAGVDKKFIKINVRDNGSGINKGDLKKVFDPFFTTKNRGTGLGFTVSKQIIDRHGGTIHIGSEPGRGT